VVAEFIVSMGVAFDAHFRSDVFIVRWIQRFIWVLSVSSMRVNVL